MKNNLAGKNGNMQINNEVLDNAVQSLKWRSLTCGYFKQSRIFPDEF